jgi:hypothetical protein
MPCIRLPIATPRVITTKDMLRIIESHVAIRLIPECSSDQNGTDTNAVKTRMGIAKYQTAPAAKQDMKETHG